MLAPEDEPLDVLWKNPSTDPSSNLTRLSWVIGAYYLTTTNKAEEVQFLLKEKEGRILFLEQ